MTLSLATARLLGMAHPGIWTDLWSAGRRNGNALTLPDGKAEEIGRKWGITLRSDVPELPSLTRQALNFTGAILRVGKALATGEAIKVSDSMREERLEICRACPSIRNDRCSHCGCFLDGPILDKASLATEQCPAGRWPQLTTLTPT